MYLLKYKRMNALLQKCSIFLKEVVQIMKYLKDGNDYLVRNLQ